ncbi:DUF3105 domain-containing protein [Chloroflexota bacterium]
MSRTTQATQPPVSRREVERAKREERRRRGRIRAIALASGVVVATALLVSWSVINASNRPGEPVPDMGNAHIEEGAKSPVAYNSTPPTSGPHYGGLARWGIHTEQIADELMVHNLEDGGVGIWYDCPDECPELVSQLESVAERYQEGVLLAPYPGMDTRIALTAWNRVDRFDKFDEERLIRFVRAFRGADHHAQR